jgi:hypothetical protein
LGTLRGRPGLLFDSAIGEKIISLATGRSKPGSEAAGETLAYHKRLLEEWLEANPNIVGEQPAAAPIRYQVHEQRA